MRPFHRWSAQGGMQGASELHLQIARIYSKQEEFDRAQQHYLRANKMKEHAKMLLRSEQDLYVAPSAVWV